jgi:hypothetical protein
LREFLRTGKDKEGDEKEKPVLERKKRKTHDDLSKKKLQNFTSTGSAPSESTGKTSPTFSRTIQPSSTIH